MYRNQTKIYTQKSLKKYSCFKFEKYSFSAFTRKKINVVAILDRFAAYFETTFILAIGQPTAIKINFVSK